MNIKGDSLTVATYVTSAAAITLMMATLITGAFRTIITPKAWTVILVSAFFPTFLSNLLFFIGIRETGSWEGAILSTLEPVVSVASGVVLLKEVLTPFQFIGVVMIIAAVLIINMFTAKDNIPNI